ncbi:major surface protease gp63, putative [Leishmania tarentolae]|uniref:Leishmanolysin n=1 Tax=Leishmania tarentolae TaxID=5689 RepID=A0A640KG76_LEITA|nr:major surface protease gp63, putative [Leishmania tarentolae]
MIMTSRICSTFEIPQIHITAGLSNAYLALYVASVPSELGVLAWAAICQLFPDGHPAVGVINIPAASIASGYYQASRVSSRTRSRTRWASVAFCFKQRVS